MLEFLELNQLVTPSFPDGPDAPDLGSWIAMQTLWPANSLSQQSLEMPAPEPQVPTTTPPPHTHTPFGQL